MRRIGMSIVAAVLIVGAAIPVLAGAGVTAPRFNDSSIAGTWLWTNMGQLATKYNFGQVGFATFDGRGKCTIALKENSGANGAYDHNSDSCTYKVAKDGTGSVEFSLDGEAGAVDFAIAGDQISFMSPDAATVSAGTMWRGGAKQPAGEYGFLLQGTIFSEAVTGAGVMTFGPKGKCSQSLVYNYGTGPQSVKTTACTYTTDAKTGFISVAATYDNDTGGDSFAVVNGDRMSFVTTVEGEILVGQGARR